MAKAPVAGKSFVASPSIAQLPDGSFVVAHDRYGSLYKNEAKVTTIYRSTDQGLTWKKQAEVSNFYWASLFVHRGLLYLMGTSSSIGNIVICKSSNNGLTWTKAIDHKTGLLFEGRFHTAPMPVVVAKGRIWRAYEEDPDPQDPRHFQALVLSAPENSDLLDVANWTKSNGLEFDENLVNARTPRWREGNMVIAPDGNLVDFIRLETRQKPKDTYALTGVAKGMTRYEVAGKIDVSADGKNVSFNLEHGFINFPGAETKFTIRYDPVSKKYWSLVNKITANKPGSNFAKSPHHQRNVVMLISSPDLIHWKEHVKLLRWNEGKTITMEDKFAFQYLDWMIDGDDLVAVARTAWDSVNYHDSNYITFHRFKNFRTLTMANSSPDLYTAPQ